MTCLSEEYSAAAGGKILFTQPRDYLARSAMERLFKPQYKFQHLRRQRKIIFQLFRALALAV
jgi:hypothetical protein